MATHNILILTRDPLISFRQLPGGRDTSIDGRYRFFINRGISSPDFVAVVGKGFREPVTLSVARQNTLLLTNEPYDILGYPKGYTRQFGVVCACQPQLKGSNVRYTPAQLPWFVGASFNGLNATQVNMTYDDIAQATPRKTKLISVITSNKAVTAGHLRRMRFVEKLKEHYQDQIDVYGRGFRSFEDKWSVLAPYRFHIAIENSSTPYYWTEKLSDCFLAGCYPIYYGCTNAADYFPEGAFAPIDISRPEECFARIDSLIAADADISNRQQLQQSKQLVLNKYNIFMQITAVCDTLKADADKQDITLTPARSHLSLHNLYLHTVGRNYYKLLSHL